MGAMITGCAGLFGTLQWGLSHADKHHVCITSHLWDHLLDFKLLAQSITLAEIVPNYPSVIGSINATKSGIGGVLFADGKAPILWQAPSPSDIQTCIISTDNLNGDITNSDLKQAGMLAQANVANTVYDLHDQMLATLNDNVFAISLNKKATITSDQSATYLCCLTSLHCCHHWYYHEVSHSSGEANEMSDTLLQCLDLTDDQLLTLLTLASLRTNLGACATCLP